MPGLATLLPQRQSILLGLLLGAAFGLWNLVGTMLDPLAEDSPLALLTFYGPMFTIWGVAGFVAFRRTGRLLDAVKVGISVAFATFVVYNIAVVVRVNLFLDVLTQRSDWRNVMLTFENSGFDSLRSYVNYMNIVGAPFKISVASAIGGVTGLIGGLVGTAISPAA